jgi:Fe-S cluster assembly protein SufD
MSAPVAPRGFTEAAVSELIERRDEPEWMRARRRDAWNSYQQLPMPSRTDEEWRRTDISRLRLDQLPPFAADDAASETLRPTTEREEAYGGFLGLRNGQPVETHLSPDLLSKGVIFTDLATAVREHGELVREHFMTRCVPPSDSKFAALHGAFWNAGTFLYVPRGVVITEPLRTVLAADLEHGSSLAHTLIVLEPGAQVTYAEDFVSPESAETGLSTRVVELILKRDAVLHYAGVQRWGRSVYDFHTERALLERDTSVTVQTIELGSRLSKGRVESVLNGSGASAKLLGLYIEDGRQHLDRYTLQDHRAPNGTSDLLFKGVLADTSRSVFSGLIRVTPEGKGTAAYQQNRNLLLSRHARADSIPNLEIGANDILGCTHGATVGKVDEEQLFYLMCRGLERVEATRLIVEGFVDPVLEAIPIPSLRDALRREVQERVSAVHTE